MTVDGNAEVVMLMTMPECAEFLRCSQNHVLPADREQAAPVRGHRAAWFTDEDPYPSG